GGGASLTVTNWVGGSVTARSSYDAPLSASTIACSSPSQCNDSAFNLEGGVRWDKTYKWFFRSSSTPSGNNVDAVEQRIRDASSTMTKVHNTCGMSNNVSAQAAYQGRTTRATNINCDASCSTRDNVSVVGFGCLPAGAGGDTCAWFDRNGAFLEADSKL